MVLEDVTRLMRSMNMATPMSLEMIFTFLR